MSGAGGRRTLEAVLLAIGVGLGVGGLWLRFNAAPGRTGAVFPYDFLNYYLPMTELAAKRLAAGELPLWNPYSCSGIPLLATLQVGAFYPGTWLAVWLPAAAALPLRMGIECALAGLFAGLLFRAWGAGLVGALAGGILYVFACVLGQVFWPPALSTLAWLPWLLLCVEKLATRWRWRWWLGLGFGAALQIAAGFPQYALYGYYLVGPYLLLRGVELRRGGDAAAMRRALGSMLALALGVGLLGAQILPTLELIGEGQRAAPLARAAVDHFGAGGKFALADVVANAFDPAPKLISPGWGRGAGYLGISTLVLLGFGVATAARRPRTWLLLAVCGISFLLSAGYREWTAPLYELYTALPGGDVFREPSRLRVLTFLCVIALAVPGFDQLARGFDGLRDRRAAAAAGWLSASAVCGVALFFGASGAALRAAATLALAAVGWLAGARVRQAAAVALIALLYTDLYHATGAGFGSFRRVPIAWARTLHAGGHVYLDAEAFAALRDSAGLGRLAFPNLSPALGVDPLAGAYRVECLEPLVPQPWPEVDRLLGRRRERVTTLGSIPLARSARLYDLAGVETIAFAAHGGGRVDDDVSDAEVERGAGPAPSPPPGARLDVLANDDALPRAYLVERYALAARHEAWQQLVDGGFDYRTGVMLDRPPGLPGPGAARPAREAKLVAYAPERVAIEAEPERDSLLVLSDTYYPGWRARVDGAEAEILLANGLYRAVRVPAGRHEIVFSYEPQSLRRGAAVSIACLALLALPPLARHRRRRP